MKCRPFELKRVIKIQNPRKPRLIKKTKVFGMHGQVVNKLGDLTGPEEVKGRALIRLDKDGERSADRTLFVARVRKEHQGIWNVRAGCKQIS